MARKPRTHSLSGRVDDDEFETASNYIESADIGMADLVRLGVAEYITNHPITEA